MADPVLIFAGRELDPIAASIRHEHILCRVGTVWHRIARGGAVTLCVRGVPEGAELRRDGLWFLVVDPRDTCLSCRTALGKLIDKAQDDHARATGGPVKCQACEGYGFVYCDCDCPNCDAEVPCEHCGTTGKVTP